MTEPSPAIVPIVRKSRIPLNALFTLFAFCLTAYAVYTYGLGVLRGDFSSIAILAFYMFMLILFVTRKEAQAESGRITHRIIAFATSLLPLLLQPAPHHPAPGLGILAAALWVVGAGGSLVAIGCLGKGFGIVAACRQVKTQGLYRWIRHPLYAFELVWFFSLVLLQLSWFNIVLFLL